MQNQAQQLASLLVALLMQTFLLPAHTGQLRIVGLTTAQTLRPQQLHRVF
jgi:hypothetical protein